MSVREVRSLEMSVAEVRSLEMSVAQGRPLKVGTVEEDTWEPGEDEVGATEIRTAEIQVSDGLGEGLPAAEHRQGNLDIRRSAL